MTQPRRTRDCLDPWTTVYVQASGDVALCCWSKPIGNLSEGPIERLLEGERALALRRGLLTGDLPEDCAHCPARDWTELAALERRVRGLEREDARLRKRWAYRGDPRQRMRLVDLRRARDAALNERASALEAGAGERVAELDALLAQLELDRRALEREIARDSYRIRKPLRWWLRRAVGRALGARRDRVG